MFLFCAILLYLIATILGVWSASLFWRARHAKRLQRTGRLADADRQRLLSPARRRFGLVVALTALPLAGGAFAFGEAVRGGGADQDLQPVTILSRATAGILAFLSLGALYVAARFDPSHGRRRCPRCWYDMSATTGLLCPECGRQPSTERAMFRTRRAPRLVLVTLLLLLGSYSASVAARVASRGWAAAVPTTALIIGLPWWPDSFISGPSASLWERAQERSLTDWQFSMLRRRAAGLLETSDDLTTIGDASWLWSLSALDLDPSAYPRISPGGQLAILNAFQADLNAGLANPRNSIVQAIQLLQPPMSPEACTLAVPIVKQSLLSNSGFTRYLGLRVAAAMGKDATPIVPDLVADASSPTAPIFGTRTVQVLAELGRTCPAAADAFLLGFTSPSDFLRLASLQASPALSPHDPRVIEKIRACLRDPSDSIIFAAASAMVQARQDPCSAKADLAELLRTTPEAVRQHLPQLAAECPDDTVVEAIRIGIRQPLSESHWALQVAPLLGALGKPLIPDLRTALENAPDDRTRDEIQRVIDTITVSE